MSTADGYTPDEMRALKELRSKMHYVSGIPRKAMPDGRVLVHSGITPYPKLGTNGFRAWTQILDETLIQCHCDWAGVDLGGLDDYLPVAWIERLNDERLVAMGLR